MEAYLHSILTPALDWVSRQLHLPVALSRGKNSVLPLEKEAGLVPDLDWSFSRPCLFSCQQLSHDS